MLNREWKIRVTDPLCGQEDETKYSKSTNTRYGRVKTNWARQRRLQRWKSASVSRLLFLLRTVKDKKKAAAVLNPLVFHLFQPSFHSGYKIQSAWCDKEMFEYMQELLYLLKVEQGWSSYMVAIIKISCSYCSLEYKKLQVLQFLLYFVLAEYC